MSDIAYVISLITVVHEAFRSLTVTYSYAV